MRPPVFLVGLLLLSGCFGGSPSDDGAPAVSASSSSTGPLAANNTTLPPPPPVTYRLTGCAEMHGFFPFPYQVIGPQLPPGFTPAFDQTGQVVNVLVDSLLCDQGEIALRTGNVTWDHAAEMRILVPVLAPDALRDPSVTADYVPLVVYTNGPDALTQLVNWSQDGSVDTGRITGSITPGAVEVMQVNAVTDDATYDLRSDVQTVAGPAVEAVHRLWLISDGGDPTGHLRITTTGAGVGSGQGIFAAVSADPVASPVNGGPPAWPGTADRVDDASVLVEFTPWSSAEG